MRAGYSIFILFVSLALFGIVEVCNADRLKYNFYRKTCPLAEKIVKNIIQNRARSNSALGAKLIRMQFHDCFVRQCPNPASPTITVEMDPGSSLSFDKNYYDVLIQNKGLFVSDAALLTDRNSRRIVTQLQRSRAFFTAFARSMRKMAAIEVLTGNAGEIRENCRVVNP
ncbi:hypothetical protein CRYUN_Cryun10bG0022400 [Craigia yunnanensis]